MAFLTLENINMRTVLIGFFIFLVLYLWFKKPKYPNLPPGPTGWPLLGYLPNLGYGMYKTGRQPYQLMADLTKVYGNVYSMYMGSKLVIMLNDQESIKEAFQSPVLNDRPSGIASGVTSHANTGVLLSNGNTWRHQRRFTLSTFRDFGIGKSRFQDKIADEIHYLVEEFVKFTGKSFNPKPFTDNAISNIVCNVVFGHRFQYSDKDFNHLLHCLDDIKNSGTGAFKMILPIINLLDTKKHIAETATRELRIFIGDIINEHKKQFDSNHMSDYIDVYINELQNGDFIEEDHLDDQSLLLTVTQLFAAASETTSNTLLWSILHMMDKPDVQTRIQEEIDLVVGRNRLPRTSDKLPYTESVIMEIQRFSTVVPLGFPHVPTEATQVRGFTIPKDCLVFANIYAVHHDPTVWKDPEVFRPERFWDDNNNIVQPESYLPFSTGRRYCLGENLARMEIFLFLTHLLHRFTIRKPTDDPPISFKSRPGVTSSPFLYNIIVTERD